MTNFTELVQPPPPAPPDRRRLWIACAVVLTVALALGVEWARRPREDAPSAPRVFLPQPVAPALTPPAPENAPPAQADELSFVDLVKVLGLEAQEPGLAPIARPFVERFKADPALKRTFQHFQQAVARGEKPTARAFIATLRGTPAFKTVSAPFVFSPAGTSAFAALAKNPQLREVMLAERKAMARAAQAQKRGLGVAGREVSAKTTLARGGASTSRFSSEASPGQAAGGAPGAAHRELGFGSAAASPPGQAGPGAHEVGRKLADVKLAQKQDCKQQDLRADTPWLRDFPAAYGLIGDYGLWGACFSIRRYGQCMTACQNARFKYKALDAGCDEIEGKEVACAAPAGGWGYGGFQACLDFRGPSLELRCIGDCKAQPPCEVPPDVWKAHCEPPAGATNWKMPDCCYADCVPPAPPPTPSPTTAPTEDTCAQLAAKRGWQPLCDNGEGYCLKFRGAAPAERTSDCKACCDYTGSCGHVAQQRGWRKAACDVTGNAQCGVRGLRTWDCEACCETVFPTDTCGVVKQFEGWGDYRCGDCAGLGVSTQNCPNGGCCSSDFPYRGPPP